MKGKVSKMRILREVCNMRLHTVMAFAGLLTTCLLISTACDWRGKVTVRPDMELPMGEPVRGPFTAFLSADRSELIRGDVEAGHATLAVATDREALFHWSFDPDNIAAYDGAQATVTEPAMAATLEITEVTGDPGAEGTDVVVTVVVVEDTLCDLCDKNDADSDLCDSDGNPVTDSDGDPLLNADGELILEHGLPVRCGDSTTESLTLSVRRPEGPLTVSFIAVGGTNVQPGKAKGLRATISGGKAFQEGTANCRTPEGYTAPATNGKPYCVFWRISEEGLSPKPSGNSSERFTVDDPEQVGADTVARAEYQSPMRIGSVDFDFMAVDADGNSIQRELTVDVRSLQPLTLHITSSAAEVQPNKNLDITATAVGGEPPYTVCFGVADLAENDFGTLGAGESDCGSLTLPTEEVLENLQLQ